MIHFADTFPEFSGYEEDGWTCREKFPTALQIWEKARRALGVGLSLSGYIMIDRGE